MEQTETLPLGEWDERERNALLAEETPDIRAKRLEAEDPQLSPVALKTLLDEFPEGWNIDRHKDRDKSHFLGVAIAAQPITPPDVLRTLIEGTSPFCNRAFCQNPIAPLLVLETPDFWERIDYSACETLLREEAAPKAIVQQMAHCTTPPRWFPKVSVAQAARLHIALAGEVKTRKEGISAITKFWQESCVSECRDADWEHNIHWHAELVELGLAPSWAMGETGPIAPPPVPSPPPYVLEWFDNQGAGAAAPKPNGNPPLWARFPSNADRHRRARLWRDGGIAPEPLRRHKATLALLLRPTASAPELMLLARMPAAKRSRLHDLISYHPHVTDTILRFLARELPNRTLRLRLAVHPLTPPDVLQKLVEYKGSGRYTGPDDYHDYRGRERIVNYDDNVDNALIRRLVCRHPNAPPDISGRARRVCGMERALRFYDKRTDFMEFNANLHHDFPSDYPQPLGRSPEWCKRLHTALRLPLRDEPFPDDLYQRSPLLLLRNLARDGNRLVRWAAQTRLTDPDFVFTWQE